MRENQNDAYVNVLHRMCCFANGGSIHFLLLVDHAVSVYAFSKIVRSR